MKKTTVINISKSELQKLGYRDLAHWLEFPDHIYIGRTQRFITGAKKSKWANPFSRKKYGRHKCIQMFRDYIKHQPGLLKNISELEGKVLGCWCKPELCHGDVLIELLDQLNNRNTRMG